MCNKLLPIEICSLCGAPRPWCHCAIEQGQTLAKTRKRWRNRKYLAFVASLPCSVDGCTGSNIQASHHGPRAASKKVHDFLAIPLCHRHHQEHHQYGDSWEYSDMIQVWQIRTIAAAIFAEKIN